jgi:pimeloyl-ACP methyl ester carboxylesterase
MFALVTSLAIHVPHAASRGFGGSDFTAVPSGVAGLILTGVAAWLIARILPNIWYRLGLVPAGLLFLIVFFFPVLLGVGVTNTARVPITGDTPADRGFAYRDVTFETQDGLTIAGWYIPSENGAAVITVHGAGKNRTKTLDHAEMLARNGYGVLMIDLRGYGESEGSINSMGWNGYRDIPAAVEFLEAQPDVEDGRVGGLGLSMGGETLLQAVGEEGGSGLAAVISEGAGARTYKEVLEIPGSGKYIITAPLFVREATISLLTGDGVPPRNDETIKRFAPNPVLLISGDIKEERDWNRIMRDRSGGSAELFEAEGGHIDGLSSQPAEYEARVIAFLDHAMPAD